MPGGTKHAKFHDSTMFRLGCKGGGGLLKGVAHLLFGSNLYRDFLGAITCAVRVRELVLFLSNFDKIDFSAI